jgi:hypothetical protein
LIEWKKIDPIPIEDSVLLVPKKVALPWGKRLRVEERLIEILE